MASLLDHRATGRSQQDEDGVGHPLFSDLICVLDSSSHGTTTPSRSIGSLIIPYSAINLFVVSRVSKGISAT